jgi:threonine/homoserine/homoserine lactone efflux protein
MGFLAAIPVGATQIEIAKRLINGYTFSAMMIVAGAVISDFTYGVIALFGIAPFLESPQSIAVFSVINSIILIVLGIITLHQNRTKLNLELNSKEVLPKRKVAFITGFLLAVTNPLMIYWWLLGSRILGSAYRIEKYDTFNIFLLLISGTLGIGSYPMTILFGVHMTKRFFSESGIRKTTIIFGIALFCLAAYFLYQALRYFMNLN